MNTDPAGWVTIVACVVAAITLAWVAALHAITRPRRPRTGPATMELGGEPPAVVDLLTDDFAVTPAAVTATVVDLAARRWLSIEEIGGGDVVIRLRTRDELLAPYERRVLDHLRGLAVDQVVPAAAMTTGPEAASKRWWRAFRNEVIDDAQARGLCRERWTATMLAPIWAGTLAAGALLWLAGEGEQNAPTDGSAVDWLWGGGLVVVLGLGLWTLTVRSRRLQRDTDAGLELASFWLGVREHMATVGDFERKPAAMVALWDRYLAHAVALDLAPLVVAQLPLGAEDHGHAWSRATGTWRQVTVRYPWIRPGFGQHPVVAFLTALVVGGIATAVIALALRLRRDEIDLVTDLPEGVAEGVHLGALVLGGIAAATVLWNVVKLVFATADAFRTERHEGVLIRARVRRGWVGLTDARSASSDDDTTERYFGAFDTGASTDVTAWRVTRSVFDELSQGERYLVRVTPRLRYVRSVERLAGPA